MEFPQTPLAWAQFLTSQLFAGYVTAMQRQAIDEYTEIDPDGTVVKATTFVTGQVAAAAVQPVTDNAVEKVWKWVVAKKDARKTHKTRHETE